MIVYKKTDEWYIEWQRVTKSGTTRDNEWQRVTTNDKKWQRVAQRVTTNANEWPFQLIFLFFQIKEKPITKHPKENFLNLEEDLWRRPIELRAETSTQKEILTVRSRNCRSSCSQIFSPTRVFLCWSPLLEKLQVLKPANLLKGDSNTGAFLWILRNF